MIMCSLTNLYAITVLTTSPAKPWFIEASGNHLLEKLLFFGYLTDSTGYKQELEDYVYTYLIVVICVPTGLSIGNGGDSAEHLFDLNS